MTFLDWLASPIGVEAQHAVIALVLAVAAYISYLARRQAKHNEQLLNGHIDQHVVDVLLHSGEHQADAASESPAARPPDAT